MFRPEPDADHPRRYAAQERIALQQAQRPGQGCRRIAGAGQNPADDPVLNLDLEALGDARGQFAPALHLAATAPSAGRPERSAAVSRLLVATAS